MSRFISAQEIIKLPMLANDDYLQREKGKLLTYAPYVFEDMQISTLKQAVREVFKINKKTNTVDLPCNENDLCSVSVMDHRGTIWPLYKNDRLHDDIVEIPADKDCNCEYKCGYSLCNIIKGYEAIQTIQTASLPNGNPITFTCINRKAIDRNGYLYTENQYPQQVFTAGVWTDTILFTEHKKVCKCDIDDNGCLCDTDENVNKFCDFCGVNPNAIPFGGNANCPPNPADEKWIYHCTSKLEFLNIQCGRLPFFREGFNNIYNISELGNRLIFPHHCAFDKVLVRYYVIPSLKNIQIPFIAVDTFVDGLKWFSVKWNDAKQVLEPKYGHTYSLSKWGLFATLNKYTLAETGIMLAPHRRMPSYYRHGHKHFGRDEFDINDD